MILRKKNTFDPPGPPEPPAWFKYWCKHEFKSTITELKQEIADVRTELKQEISDVKLEITTRLDNIVSKNNLKE